MWQSCDGFSGRFVVVAVPGGRRVELFGAALAARGLAPPRVVSWADVLSGAVHLAEVVCEGDVVRLESPGKDFEVERALLAAGARAADGDDPAGDGYYRAPAETVKALEFDKGLILWPRQWYLGFVAALRAVEAQLDECPPHARMNDAGDIAAMFDKPACHARLATAGVPVPPALPPVRSFDELTAAMADAGWRRVFVKLAHGSSGSGVVAYQVGGSVAEPRHRAVTTAEMVRQGGGLRLYNSRRLRAYTDPREIATLVDALARHRVHVEQWLPKAGMDGRACDLRVVVIGGRARHAVVRLSRSPITNLHLLNDRAEPRALRRQMGESAWAGAMRTCERVMACFPRSLHGGVDLLVATDLRRHAVLEVNAFGDLLPGALWSGTDTYGAEIDAVLGDVRRAQAAEAAGGVENRLTRRS